MTNLQDKWLNKWREKRSFESDPDERKPFYLTVAYPYPSGGMHIGHARTYTVPDVIARYKRMKGYNVLFPMAWHVTGTPIIGALNRLRDKEEKQLNILKQVYAITEEKLKSIKEPMDYARYFINEHYLPSMKALGYSIDWRRQFTTNDVRYNKFITWQYETLYERGLIKKGKHPVKYCVKCDNPVTTHDLLEGEDSNIQEFTLLKFEFGNDYLVAATLRPETIYGQTNMWVNPDVAYVRAQVDGQSWIISRECAEKLKLQDKEVEITGEITGQEMIGKRCTAALIDRQIPILPSEFPDPSIGSGLVTSVPSDAPYDYIALKDLQKSREKCEQYGLDYDMVKSIKTIPIIEIEGYGPEAAKDVIERMDVQSQKEVEKLEQATKEVYKAGFHSGVMNENCGKYKNMAVVRAKEKIKENLLNEGKADTMLEFSEKVICRCAGLVVIAKADSWFIDYANEDWKQQVKGAIYKLKAIPERTKQDYENTVEWLHEWPCIRNYGLGTKLPFDDRFMIEPLSDSTIYMAYYTISHIIKDVKAEKLTNHFFDYIFRNIGEPQSVSKQTGIDMQTLKDAKKSFEYWYPQDFRCSALELIQNHLTFMLYHHCALFNPDKWPKGIATFGMGLLEGDKMSSSKGNVILVKQAIEKHSPDVVRLFLMSNAEPWQDFDWRENLVESTQKRLNQFSKLVEHRKDYEDRPFSTIDRWMLSRLNKRIKDAEEALEGFQTRKAVQSIFYELMNDVSWYLRRTKPNRMVWEELSESWIKLMNPFTPYLCEELWEKSGQKDLLCDSTYPTAKTEVIDETVEAGEDYLRDIIQDVKNIVNVTNKQPNKVNIYLSQEWKIKAFNLIKEGKSIKEIMSDPKIKKHGKAAAKLAQTRKEEIPPTVFTKEQEKQKLVESKDYLEKELEAAINIDPVDDPEGKSKIALPMKPGLYLS